MENKKNIISIIAVLAVALFLGGLFIIGRARVPAGTSSAPAQASLSTASSSGIQDALAAAESAYNFGTVSMARGVVRHAFPLRNAGGEPVVLEKLYTSCMCTTAKFVQDGMAVGPFGMQGHGFVPPLRKTLRAGEEAVVEVTFDPAAHGPAGVGRIERAVRIEPRVGAPLEFTITANVVP